jgi:hypothetical protein
MSVSVIARAPVNHGMSANANRLPLFIKRHKAGISKITIVFRVKVNEWVDAPFVAQVVSGIVVMGGI